MSLLALYVCGIEFPNEYILALLGHRLAGGDIHSSIILLYCAGSKRPARNNHGLGARNE